jgi:hypothetical protein
MSKASDLAARTSALAPTQQPKTVEVNVDKAPAARAHPYKMTILLEAEVRQILKDYPEKMHLPARSGKANIPGAEVIRALLRELGTNADLQVAVAKRVLEAVKE